MEIKITVLTPSVRPESLEIIGRCLRRQDFQEYEWLVVGPERIKDETEVVLKPFPHTFLIEPPKKQGDYYALCKAMNLGFAKAKGELIIMIQDGIWFEPDLLSRFYSHYAHHPNGLFSAIGHQYSVVENWKPEHLVWSDPRINALSSTFNEVSPNEIEFAVCALPRQATLDSGGIDETYDQGAAVGEKEICWRLQKLGYEFYIDTSIEYRAVHHPRLNPEWDDKYAVSSKLFSEHMLQLHNNQRTLKIDALSQYR